MRCVSVERFNEVVQRNQEWLLKDFSYQFNREEFAILKSQFATSSLCNRFPEDFTFHFDAQEFASLRSQNATSKNRGGSSEIGSRNGL